MFPLAVLSHLRPRFTYIIGNYGHARSQGGRHSAAAKTALYIYFVYLCWTASRTANDPVSPNTTLGTFFSARTWKREKGPPVNGHQEWEVLYDVVSQTTPDEYPPTPPPCRRPALITLRTLTKFQLVWRRLCDVFAVPLLPSRAHPYRRLFATRGSIWS